MTGDLSIDSGSCTSHGDGEREGEGEGDETMTSIASTVHGWGEVREQKGEGI